MWRDFPDRMASATGCGALVYSRMGYGASDPVRGARPVAFMHDEALDVLPAVIEQFKIKELILFGHSDGASIAISYAGAGFGTVRALVLEAPHVFVESVCIDSISRIAQEYDLPAIESPVLVIQGEDDEYGTLRQVEAVVRQVKGPAESLVLPRCAHSPHSDQPDAVLEAASGFIRQALDLGR
jgi:pimeloyl-ACP methyl ester carboxylesterase